MLSLPKDMVLILIESKLLESIKNFSKLKCVLVANINVE